MTTADYQAQTAANLKRLESIHLDLSVLDALETSEEPEAQQHTSGSTLESLPGWTLLFGSLVIGLLTGVTITSWII